MLKIFPSRSCICLALLLTFACLSGCGLSSGSHHTPPSTRGKVILTWRPEPSVLGYYVYRGGQSGGPYTKISGLQPTADYTDSTVSFGEIYYYVVTVLGKGNVESGYSKEVQAVIPAR